VHPRRIDSSSSQRHFASHTVDLRHWWASEVCPNEHAVQPSHSLIPIRGGELMIDRIDLIELNGAATAADCEPISDIELWL